MVLSTWNTLPSYLCLFKFQSLFKFHFSSGPGAQGYWAENRKVGSPFVFDSSGTGFLDFRVIESPGDPADTQVSGLSFQFLIQGV